MVSSWGDDLTMRSVTVLLTSGLLAAAAVPAAMAAAQSTLAPAPAAAASPAVATPRPLLPSNTVHCVFDMMPAEDREISMLLLENEILTDGEFDASSRNVKTIERLIGDAGAKCAAAFDWSIGRATAASDFAMSALFNDGLSQFIELMGQQAKPIETYFAEHRLQLAGSSSVRGVAALHFKAYLVEQGWDEDDQARLGIGVSYLETLIAQDGYVQEFSAAPVHAAPVKALAKPALRAIRPKRARHGTP